MLYVKNVPHRERALRLVLAVAALAIAATADGPARLVLGIGGAMLAVTGLVGFCPACAMMGRRLDKGR